MCASVVGQSFFDPSSRIRRSKKRDDHRPFISSVCWRIGEPEHEHRTHRPDFRPERHPRRLRRCVRHDVDGEMYPVTLGKQMRINSYEEHPFHYASADMIANGKVVGHVIYTDH